MVGFAVGGPQGKVVDGRSEVKDAGVPIEIPNGGGKVLGSRG